MNFDKVVGVGGLGTGILFLTNQMDTLGRNESRLAELSSAKDYCKQQIVLFYTARLLCPRIPVIPLGFVGDDEEGAGIIKELRSLGMDTSRIGSTKKYPTVKSVCLQYPNKDTCNVTAGNCAGRLVEPEYIVDCLNSLNIDYNTLLAVVPEVPVQARLEMIEQGKKAGAFVAFSAAASEMEEFEQTGAFEKSNLIVLNEEEAAALTGSGERGGTVAKTAYAKLQKYREEIQLLVTCGAGGAYSWYLGREEYIPCFPAEVKNTTGAGDACLGGTIAGIVMGLPFQKGRSDSLFGESRLASAPELGVLCSGMAVQSEDSIAWNTTRDTLKRIILDHQWDSGLNLGE